jgi:23S rRNA pseudouridine1911/1915/1917 synthase
VSRAAFEATPGRLDAVAAAALDRPRADVQRAIAAGEVLVDGVVRPKSHRLSGGEQVVVDTAERTALEPDPSPVPVRYRDEHLMIVAKPAGVVTHPTASRRTGTLVNRLLGMGVPLSAGAEPDRPGIVHRLDAGTSGLIVVASTDAAHSGLAEMFFRHDVDRRYLALVRGRVEHDHFAVDAPLERDRARIKVRISSGRQAETEFEVVERFERATLLEAKPRTGRTHQIRAHLSSAGHPILGDRTYGGGGDDATALGLLRPFLHSWRVAFDHPMTGERVELEEALPEDLSAALRRLRRA